MAQATPTYDLVLMLDTAADEGLREKIVADTEKLIGKGGELIGRHDWGTRTTAYEIRHKTDAEYHLLQFHAKPETLEGLHRTLRITDGIVRFRIIKLAPGTPGPPEGNPEVIAAAAGASAPAAPAAPTEAAPAAAEVPAVDAAPAAAEVAASDGTAEGPAAEAAPVEAEVPAPPQEPEVPVEQPEAPVEQPADAPEPAQAPAGDEAPAA